MNFKHLEDLRTHHRNLQTAPKKKSPVQRTKDPYKQGLLYLYKARQLNFTHKEWLSKAFSSFQAAQELSPRDVRVYLALAYLFLLAEDTPNARLCLHKVQSLDHNNSDLQILLDFMAQQGSPSRAKNLDYEGLYLQTEHRVRDLVHQYTQRALPSTLESEQELHYQHELESLNQVCAQILEQMDILEAEMDTAPLRSALRPLDLISSRYQDLLDKAQERTHLKNVIEEHQQWALEALKCIDCFDLKQELCLLHADYEQELDACDLIAEHLDRLDKQGALPPTLLALYEQWIHDLEAVGDGESLL